MSRIIDDVVETARGLHDAGVMQERTLVSMIDLRVDTLELEVIELEQLVRTLSHALWNYQEACDGDRQMQEVIAEALGNVPSRYINFLD